MKAHLPPYNPMQALIKAIYELRPPVLQGVQIDVEKHGLEVVRLEVEVTPELIQAWGEHCKEIKRAVDGGQAPRVAGDRAWPNADNSSALKACVDQ